MNVVSIVSSQIVFCATNLCDMHGKSSTFSNKRRKTDPLADPTSSICGLVLLVSLAKSNAKQKQQHSVATDKVFLKFYQGAQVKEPACTQPARNPLHLSNNKPARTLPGQFQIRRRPVHRTQKTTQDKHQTTSNATLTMHKTC